MFCANTFPSVAFTSNVCCARAHSSFLSLLSWQRCLLAASRRWLLLLLAPRSRALLLPHPSTMGKVNWLSSSMQQGKRVTKKAFCWTEIKLYAAISKNLRFMKNIHLEGEIRQGVVDGCQEPTVPTLLQKPAPAVQAPEVFWDAGKFMLLLAALLWTANKLQPWLDSPCPQGAAPLHGKQPALPPGTCSCQWQTNQPLSFEATLTQDPKNKSWCQPLCSWIS